MSAARRTPAFTKFVTATGFQFTPAQSVLCRVAFDGIEPGSLEGEDRELARTLFGDVDEVPAHARSIVALVKGARIGGTLLASIRLLHLALTLPLDTLAAGELGAAIIVSYDLKLARQALRYALGFVRKDSRLRGLIDGEINKDGFVLRRADGQRIAIECLPATRGGASLRGRSLVGVQMSEAAFFRDADSGVVNDREIFNAVAPRLLPGAQLIVESTPWISSGVLFELDRDNFGDPQTALVADCPTLFMRPDERTRHIVEDEQRREPDNALREFGGRAGFLGGGASTLFDPIAIERAMDDERPLVVHANGEFVAAGMDLGLVRDSSTLALVGFDSSTQRLTLLELVEHRPQKGDPLKLSEVVASFASTMKSHRVHDVAADGHAREPAREWATQNRIAISNAPEGAAGKSDSYVAFATALREGRVNLPRHPRLAAQLRGIVAKPVSGGGFAITSPRRAGLAHGDLVSAVVLAAWQAQFGAVDYGALMKANPHGF